MSTAATDRGMMTADRREPEAGGAQVNGTQTVGVRPTAGPELVSPPAVRLRPPGWRDPRLLVGIVLVACSVALGSWAFATADRTAPVYAADGPLVAGDPVTPDDVTVRQVRLGDAAEAYLPADVALPDGLVAVRTVGDGELLPAAAVVDGGALDVRPIAVHPDGPVSSRVVQGSLVDLWSVPDGSEHPSGAVDVSAPRQLADGLVVAEVSEPSGTFSVSGGPTVHVLVPVADLADVLAALAGGGSVEVVPVPGAASS